MGREEGVTETQLRDLSSYETSEAFNELEKQVIGYAAALSNTPAPASDEQVAALRDTFDDEQLVELTAMIAWENFRARFNRGLDIGDQGYSEGAYCALPENHDVLREA